MPNRANEYLFPGRIAHHEVRANRTGNRRYGSPRQILKWVLRWEVTRLEGRGCTEVGGSR